ncbi:DNA mismatch repair protein MutL [Gymnopilus junonius]|uniref:DNA mismatch repair protein MutL n=1 Tax=Gymnopilus junonius TaxID=109634 RepID=A0A9P5NP03_GYMJU|nr:DNA mismatch repair protein MutL [Gymnopilus junonius]
MDDTQVADPKPIRRLDETLINKIAAGEIIHRPASALKELLENSLDAGATSIKVTVKEGGMKLLQIQDNGHGIRKADLPILAERFTTSKLSTFSDLSRITTYGFRGEALASISHVAHLSVVTKTKTDSCAWKATFVDGSLVDTKTGQKSEPRPSAGNDGTTISIEDLFYNTPTRLSALRSSSEEYSRILDVMIKYAIHNPSVSFICKKAGSPSPDLSTPSSSETSTSIRLLYGHSITKELIHSKVSSARKQRKDDDAMDEDDEERDDPESWDAEIYFTNVNYQAKKMVFLLFINHRLVESPRMKRALEAAYQSVLPKGTSPFLYLSLQIDPRSVDVNVHPTKREVHFLNEEAITEKIADTIQENLAKQSHSRTFEYQTLLTGTGGILNTENILPQKRPRKEKESSDEDRVAEEQAGPPQSTADPKRKVYSHQKVRTSLQDRTLDSMFRVTNQSQPQGSSSKVSETTTPPGNTLSKSRDIKESQCFLTSIKNLRQSVLRSKHRQLSEIIEKHIFVGIVDIHRCLSLVQCSTKLYLLNHDALAEELFYQLGLRQFGDFSRIKLDPPPSLREMIKMAVDAEEDLESSTSLTKPQIVDRVEKILVDRREMLSEYFSLNISDDGHVESIPLLLRDYIPNLDNLPNFLMRLGPQVDWMSEAECFETFLRELAYFYTPTLPTPTSADVQEKDQYKAERWQIQHILFPAMRRYLIPSKSLLDRDVVQIANLPDLYKVFERC